MGHSTTGHKGHTSWEVVDFSIIQVYPCFAEFYLTDKASWIELSGKRTRGDVFWSESDVVSLHTYIHAYLHTYIPIAKQGCDCDGEDFFRPVIQISLLFGVQAADAAGWILVCSKNKESIRLDCSIEKLFPSRGHDLDLAVTCVLYVSYIIRGTRCGWWVTLEGTNSVPGHG